MCRAIKANFNGGPGAEANPTCSKKLTTSPHAPTATCARPEERWRVCASWPGWLGLAWVGGGALRLSQRPPVPRELQLDCA
eukprot:scaffold179262_cov39-Tisochrysis_lutea.AAC.1